MSGIVLTNRETHTDHSATLRDENLNFGVELCPISCLYRKAVRALSVTLRLFETPDLTSLFGAGSFFVPGLCAKVKAFARHTDAPAPNSSESGGQARIVLCFDGIF